METKAAVFLDKDGTIIPDIPYNVNPDLITLKDGVLEGLLELQQHFLLFIVSNQSGVAKGFFQINALYPVKAKLQELFKKNGILISDYYFCPHDPAGIIRPYAIECNCRKPKPGMLLQAAKDHNLNLSHSWMIGDILNDIQAGKTAGCKSILINNGNETEWDTKSSLMRVPDFIADDFLEATTFINQNKNRYVNDRHQYI